MNVSFETPPCRGLWGNYDENFLRVKTKSYSMTKLKSSRSLPNEVQLKVQAMLKPEESCDKRRAGPKGMLSSSPSSFPCNCYHCVSKRPHVSKLAPRHETLVALLYYNLLLLSWSLVITGQRFPVLEPTCKRVATMCTTMWTSASVKLF